MTAGSCGSSEEGKFVWSMLLSLRLRLHWKRFSNATQKLMSFSQHNIFSCLHTFKTFSRNLKFEILFLSAVNRRLSSQHRSVSEYSDGCTWSVHETQSPWAGLHSGKGASICEAEELLIYAAQPRTTRLIINEHRHLT